MRAFGIAVLGAALFVTFAVTDASAEMRKKGGSCKAVDKPKCNLVLRADCTKQNKCCCQKWVCRL